MKLWNTRLLAIILVVFVLISVAGCSSKGATEIETKEEIDETAVETETEPEPDPIPTLPTNMNPLTGLECSEDLVGKRPIGVMFNNLKAALPQVNLSKCDIIYEVLAEGGILRFEGLILDYANAGDLGSIRSARPYYISLAKAYDAIYVHAGGSDAAYSILYGGGVDHLDGVKGNFYVNDELLFWRDQNRLNSGYNLEHTMFATGSDIADGISKKGFRTSLNQTDFTAFAFDPAFEGIGSGLSAVSITIPHSNYSISEFQYNADSGMYMHSQYGSAHIDGATNQQIQTKNVFILFTQQSIADSYGRRSITLVGEGQGYYLNGGEYVAITWKRANENEGFRYYTADGVELKVCQGTSFVSLVDSQTAASVTIS